MKIIATVMMIAALLGASTVLVGAQEKAADEAAPAEEAATGFGAELIGDAMLPMDDAIKGLTEAQKDEAKGLRKEAMAKYAKVLQHDKTDRVKVLKRNRKFLVQRLELLKGQITRAEASLKAINDEFHGRYRTLEKLALSSELTEKKKMELLRTYQDKHDYLQYALDTDRAHYTRMRDRLGRLDLEIVDIAPTEVCEVDKWAKLDDVRKKEAQSLYEGIERMKQKERDSYLTEMQAAKERGDKR